MSAGHATSIQERILELTSFFSQSEVARRTGVPQPSVSRYVGGQRIPGDVCGKIVEHLGVQADWLLTGRGQRFTTDLDPAEQPVARKLEGCLAQVVTDAAGLVLALECRERPDPGSVSELLVRHRAHQAELEDLLRPVVEAIRARVDIETHEGALDTGADHWRIVDLLLELVTAPQLRRMLFDAMAFELSATGQPWRALEFRRASFRSNLLVPEQDFERYSMQQYNYVVSLTAAGALDEARRVVGALLELHADRDDTPSYWELQTLFGVLDVELGDLETGLQRLQKSVARTREPYAAFDYTFLLSALVLAGCVDLPSAVAGEIERTQPMGARFRTHVALRWLWQVVALDPGWNVEPLCAHMGPDACESSDPIFEFAPYLARVQAASGSDAKLAVEEYRELSGVLGLDSADAVEPIERAILLTALARIAEHGSAGEILELSQRLLANAPEAMCPPLMARVLHHRNTLALLPECARDPGRRESAQSFLDEHVRRGYRAFRVASPLADGADRPTTVLPS